MPLTTSHDKRGHFCHSYGEQTPEIKVVLWHPTPKNVKGQFLSFQLLATSGIPWLVATSLSSLYRISQVLFITCPLLSQTLDVGANCISQVNSKSLIISTITVFPSKVVSIVSDLGCRHLPRDILPTSCPSTFILSFPVSPHTLPRTMSKLYLSHQKERKLCYVPYVAALIPVRDLNGWMATSISDLAHFSHNLRQFIMIMYQASRRVQKRI